MSHPGAHVPELTEWLGWWTFDPFVLLGLVAATGVYTLGLARMSSPSLPRACAFYAGILTCAVALLSPVDHASDILFSAHMVQHELLMLVAAPLFVLGRPYVVTAWVLPARRYATLWRYATLPPIALAAHAIARLVWHIPWLFDLALRHEWVHAIQHLTFFITAAMFWASLASGRYGRFGYGVGVAFVFCTLLYTGLLAALFTFAEHAYYAQPAVAWGVDPVEDQQTAGLVMWVPAAIVMTASALAILAAWLGQLERQAER